MTKLMLMDVRTDFKPEPRIVDRKALDRAMANHAGKRDGGRCVACRRAQATEPHHVIYRSAQGDDLEDNIAPLCWFCHRIHHYGQTDERHEASASIGKGLTDDNIRYVLRKMGVVPGSDYLRRRYFLSVPGRLQKEKKT